MKRITGWMTAGGMLGFLAMGAAMIGSAGAQTPDMPVDGGKGMLPAASKPAEEVHFFHNGILLPVITVISLFV